MISVFIRIHPQQVIWLIFIYCSMFTKCVVLLEQIWLDQVTGDGETLLAPGRWGSDF